MTRPCRTIALRQLLPALADEGLLEAVLEAEGLLASQAHHGRQRWRELDWQGVLDHLRGHLEEVAEGVETDADTGHPSAAHLTARALMVLALALETRP